MLGPPVSRRLGGRPRQGSKRNRSLLSDALGPAFATHNGLARQSQHAGKPGLGEAELLAVLSVLLGAHSLARSLAALLPSCPDLR